MRRRAAGKVFASRLPGSLHAAPRPRALSRGPLTVRLRAPLLVRHAAQVPPMRFGVVILPETAVGRAAGAVAASGGARLRPRVDLRPPGLAHAARLGMVRRGPDTHGRRRCDRTDPAGSARGVAELPSSGAVREGADHARRHLAWAAHARGWLRRNGLGRDHARRSSRGRRASAPIASRSSSSSPTGCYARPRRRTADASTRPTRRARIPAACSSRGSRS